MKSIVGMALGICLIFTSGWAAEQPPVMEQKVKDSYSLGYTFGRNLKVQEIDVDAEVIDRAVRDALAGSDPMMSIEEMESVLQGLRAKVIVLQGRRLRELSSKNLDEGKAFLKENAGKEGVVTLPSGLQYKILKEGTGPKPMAMDTVQVRYRGSLVNGAEFDSTYSLSEQPSISVNGVIKGWTEALPLMKTGSQWLLFIPAELGYGERQYGRVPPNSALIFELELLSIAETVSEHTDTTISDKNPSKDACEGGCH